MTAKIIGKKGKKLTIEITVDLEDSMLDSEEAIQESVNKAGALASEEALKQFDTQGQPIEVKGKTLQSKGEEEKRYQTPYGEIKLSRHVYQYKGKGKTFCPLEYSARIIGTSTPQFSKQVSFKMAYNAARVVQKDLSECHQRDVSVAFLQNSSASVAEIVQKKEGAWHYALPKIKEEITTIAIGLDGTCMHLKKEGWREAMTGTISFYNAKTERQHTIYIGATPEYGKRCFFERFTREIEQVKSRYPHVKYIGVADGAEVNWRFLAPYIETEVLDFFHASGYLGAVAKALHPRNSKKQREWLDIHCHQLKHESNAADHLYKEMLKAQKEAAGLSKVIKEKLDKTVTYYKNHKHQMDYAGYASKKYPIGSGVTEAACKTLIKQRLCLSGMRWKEAGATCILNLRALNLTAERWHQFWRKINQFGIGPIPAL